MPSENQKHYKALVEEAISLKDRTSAIKLAMEWNKYNQLDSLPYLYLGALHHEDFHAALSYYSISLALAPSIGDLKIGAYKGIINLAIKHNNIELAVYIANIAQSSHCNDPEIVSFLKNVTKTSIPGMAINCQPKSASIFIRHTLTSNLPIGHLDIVDGYNGHIVYEFDLFNIKLGFMTTHMHMEPLPENKRLTSKHLDRMIVHVRDPRSAAVSFAHMVQNPAKDPYNNYKKCEIEEQIDIQLKTIIPKDLKFIQGWLDAEQDPDFKTELKFTKYEDLVDDPYKFFKDIYKFFGVDPDQFPINVRQPDVGDVHYREGKKYGWRKDLTDEQKELALEMIPDHILDRFGWPRE